MPCQMQFLFSNINMGFCWCWSNWIIYNIGFQSLCSCNCTQCHTTFSVTWLQWSLLSFVTSYHSHLVLVILKHYKYKQLTQFSVTAEPAVQSVFFCFCSNESAPNLQYHNQWRLAGRLVKLPPLVDVASKSFIHTCVLLHQQCLPPP